ncbi:cupin domain-containing protein [Streptomyces roseoverticillatus]|uniref:cupin domain-containing protein n=1 Tax=Streptomyces roseoverticillatus TaxID=66429 RepID=UPI001F228C2A|nr:cupin domain-containing protein [Streptomyces roseoverticillatus]MCF3100652.1 cupin domain-containing protein [Streptomyces roseoverticillatus]
MTVIDLNDTAAALPDAWRSRVLGRVGPACLKVLRMSELPVEEESHDAPEALLVLDGQLELDLGGELVTVGAGGLCVVPAGARHAVRPGSRGTLVIVELEEGDRDAA